MRKARLLLSLFAAVLLIAACGTTAPTDRDDRGDDEGNVTLTITSDDLTNASLGVEYAFKLTAEGLPSDLRGVVFSWWFDDGVQAYQNLGVVAGGAEFEFRQAFEVGGTHILHAEVGKPTSHDSNDYEALASVSLEFVVSDDFPDTGVEFTVSPSSVTDGRVGEDLTFDFAATGIPAGLSTVNFTWGIAGTDGGTANVTVADGEANHSAVLTFDRAGSYTLNAFVAEVAGDVLAVGTASIVIVADDTGTDPDPDPGTDPEPGYNVSLTIDPSAINDGVVREEYSFTMEATGIPAEMTEVIFAWYFKGQVRQYQRVTVADGAASHTVRRTFDAVDTYYLDVEVGRPLGGRDNDYELLDTAFASIGIGVDVPENEVELGSCEGWVGSQSGGHGVTVDRWDLTNVPVGASINFRYDTYTIPDNFVIEYDDEEFRTGWVGDFWHAWFNPGLYPGGVVSGPEGERAGVFTKVEGQNELVVTVFGPDRNTAWNYSLSCTE